MKIINDLSPLGNWLVNKYNDYPITKHKVSASRVGCNVRKNVLTNRHQHEFHERASDLFKPTLGKVQHKQILGAIKEEFGDKVVVEETFEGYDDDKGTPDLYIKYPIALGQAGWLIDLKCVNATTWLLNDTDWHHYNLQLQHNRQQLLTLPMPTQPLCKILNRICLSSPLVINVVTPFSFNNPTLLFLTVNYVIHPSFHRFASI